MKKFFWVIIIGFFSLVSVVHVEASEIEVKSIEVLTKEAKKDYAAQFLIEIITDKKIQILTTSSRNTDNALVAHSNVFEYVGDNKYVVTTNPFTGGSEGVWEVYTIVAYAADGSFVHLQGESLKLIGDPSFEVLDSGKEVTFQKGTDMFNVPLDKEFTISFNTRVLAASISGHNVYMVDKTGKEIELKVSLDKSKKKLTISPVAPLKPYSRYTIFIKDLKSELHRKKLKVNTKFEVYTK